MRSPRRRQVIRRLALCGLLAGAAAVPAADRPLPPGSSLAATGCAPDGPLRGEAGRGQALFREHCAECHGADGRGQVIVMHMDTPPRDQSDPAYMRTLSDAYLYAAICRGGAAVGRSFVMPAWGPVLSDRDIRDLVAWVRTYSGT